MAGGRIAARGEQSITVGDTRGPFEVLEPIGADRKHEGAYEGTSVQDERAEAVDRRLGLLPDVQTKDRKHIPFIAVPRPATHLNEDILAKYRAETKKLFYAPSRSPTYLDQLGIKYPVTRPGR